MSLQNHFEVVESDAATTDSDDSQEDPSFDILEETQSNFSKLSIKKKPRSRVPMGLDEDTNFTESSAPELDASEEKSFEVVQKIIEGCQVEKLKVEQCKLYLRKHGLRLTGKKDILIQRIKEHISIMNGEGEHKYPASSFVMNCRGDACTGDALMFEQNVYEMFNVASRSASGPPCGKRIVAGRIVKESYGAAKQQHTFTIEVLWSKGVKALPPLHPLLIKGRNLYRLKTLRQIWEDESQRQKILCEKHARGNAARTDREVRLNEKETRKALQQNRDSNRNLKNKELEKKRRISPTRSMTYSRTSIQPEAINMPVAISNPHAGAPFNRGILGNRPSTSMFHNHHGALHNENINPNTSRGLVDGPFNKSFQVKQNMGLFYPYHSTASSIYYPPNPRESYGFQQASNSGYLLPRGHYHYQGQGQKLCKYYAQGRCRHGTNCKYLH